VPSRRYRGPVPNGEEGGRGLSCPDDRMCSLHISALSYHPSWDKQVALDKATPTTNCVLSSVITDAPRVLSRRKVQEVRLRSKTCATSTIRVGTLTLCQEREMGAGCGTPIRGPWAGLETCELPPDGGASAVAVLWPRSGAARAGESRAVRPGAGASRAHHGPSGACAGRPRPGAGRARAGDGHERSSGDAGSEIRPPQRRYPAAIPGPLIVTKEASI
jgi:hypothetical protein